MPLVENNVVSLPPSILNGGRPGPPHGCAVSRTHLPHRSAPIRIPFRGQQGGDRVSVPLLLARGATARRTRSRPPGAKAGGPGRSGAFLWSTASLQKPVVSRRSRPRGGVAASPRRPRARCTSPADVELVPRRWLHPSLGDPARSVSFRGPGDVRVAGPSGTDALSAGGLVERNRWAHQQGGSARRAHGGTGR